MRQQSRPLAECPLEELWRGQLAQELARYHALQAELKQLETKLTDLARRDERIQLLEAIPGVGRVTAEIIAEKGEKNRATQLSASRQL